MSQQNNKSSSIAGVLVALILVTIGVLVFLYIKNIQQEAGAQRGVIEELGETQLSLAQAQLANNNLQAAYNECLQNHGCGALAFLFAANCKKRNAEECRKKFFPSLNDPSPAQQGRTKVDALCSPLSSNYDIISGRCV